jgi:hypothetical protein
MSGSDGQLRAEKRKIRIFICSSGDMLAERDGAALLIARLAEECRNQVELEAYRWEDCLRRFDAAKQRQANIELPATFDIFLGVLYSRIGTALSAEAYWNEIKPALAHLRATWEVDGAATLDADRLGALTGTLAEVPTGTQFEIANALDAAHATGLPAIWLAYNRATPPDERRREVRESIGAVEDYVASLSGTPIHEYGEGTFRTAQLLPGGLAAFATLLEAWLRETLQARFGIVLHWAGKPYVGLRPFTETEAPIFCGRTDSVREAFGVFNAAVAADQPPVMLLTGPSGVGKSSFARAGLIGGLKHHLLHRRRSTGSLLQTEAVQDWVWVATRPLQLGQDPATALLSLLAEAIGTTAAALGAAQARLRREGATGAAGIIRDMVQRDLAERGKHAPAAFVLLDQLDDMFADPTPGAIERARAVLELLGVLANSSERNIYVCITIADHRRAELKRQNLLPLIAGARRYTLQPPSPTELDEIITTPARLTGLHFERRDGLDLSERVTNDLREFSLNWLRVLGPQERITNSQD